MTNSSTRNAPTIKRFFQTLARNFFNSPGCYLNLTLKSLEDRLNPHTLRVGGFNLGEWLGGAFL
jgi:hypothetical protein